MYLLPQYKRADFVRANDLLCDLELHDILDPSDIHVSWSRFKAVFLDVMEQRIPRTVLPDRKNLPWLNKGIIQLIRRRNLYLSRLALVSSSVSFCFSFSDI